MWYGPSPLPLLWVNTIRFFPYAVAILWPVVRLTPPELRDAARVDGASPAREFLFVAVPMHAAVILRAAVAVGVLSLGEVSAGKLVSTPGWDSFAEVVWTQMHYGVTNNLAALCLLMLAAVGAGAALLGLQSRLAATRSESASVGALRCASRLTEATNRHFCNCFLTSSSRVLICTLRLTTLPSLPTTIRFGSTMMP